MRVVDLTQRLGPLTVMWPGAPPPVIEAFETHAIDGGFSRLVSLHEHSGTHLDAPAHFSEDAATVDELPEQDLVCPLAAVDVAARAAHDPDYRVSVSDLERDEARHGAIGLGSAVVIHTGWGRHCADAAMYLGRDDDAVRRGDPDHRSVGCAGARARRQLGGSESPCPSIPSTASRSSCRPKASRRCSTRSCARRP